MSKNFRNKLTENHAFIRFLEILPGLTTWIVIFAPVFLSVSYPIIVAYYIIIFDIYWFFKAVNTSRIILAAYGKLNRSVSYNWLERCRETEDIDKSLKKAENDYAYLFKKAEKGGFKKIREKKKELKHLRYKIRDLRHLLPIKDQVMDWKEIYHLVIFPTYEDEITTLEPAVKSLSKCNYPLDKVICCFTGEARDHDIERYRRNAAYLTEKYGDKFFMFFTLEHPDGLPGEAKVKGANVTWATHQIREILHEKGISSEQVLVHSLDSDTQVHPEYLGSMSYYFAMHPKRHKRSFQPIPMFYNNIWDAPAPNRLLALNSSFFQMIESIRTRRLRNFSGHAMSMKCLEDVDYWDKISIVEDGKQYWRAFFAFDGDYAVVPTFIPVYNDAVLSETYFKTLVSQYLQRRRWYYGVSDFPFIVINSIRNKKIPLWYRLLQIWRHYAGVVTLATASLTIAFVAWMPLFLNPAFGDTIVAHNLPIVASRILTACLFGMLISVWISIILIPGRPKNYPKWKSVSMILQWFFTPIIVIPLSTVPALESQTRLMLGKYLGFYVTPKVVKKVESK